VEDREMGRGRVTNWEEKREGKWSDGRERGEERVLKSKSDWKIERGNG
jgi:hypothetical protein